MDKVVLASNEFMLDLVAESDWQCHVYFSDGENYKNYYLGVNSVAYVCSYLISGITKKAATGEQTLKHENSSEFWIMSLFVGHVCLYGSASEEGIKLICEEDGGHDLPAINLDEDCIKNWVAQLSELQLKYQ